MTRRAARVPFLVGVVLVLAACSGSGAASSTASDAGGGGTTATTAPDASAPEATAGATADSGGGSGSGGGGDFAGKVCDLVSLDAVNAVTAVAATKQEEQAFTQGSGFCTYTGDAGTPIAAVSLVGGSMADANLVFSAYKADPSAEVVPVNGGEAIWYGGNVVAIVLKNGYTGSVQVIQPKDGDTKAASVALLQGLADNMP